MDTKKIGEFLRGLRKEKGLTQEQLAEILLVSGRTVSRWETGTNLPDLSILIQMAEFYDVEVKEILDGERRNGKMEKELKETLSKVADYSRLEKEKAAKAANTAFCSMFVVCGAMIVVQLLAAGKLSAVAGETAALLAGGIVYIGMMLYHGIWETGAGVKSTPFKDFFVSLVCSGIFTAILVLCYIRLGADMSRTAHMAVLFFVGITVLSFGLLRALVYFDRRRRAKKQK